ncbi:MAG: hypothetical protein ACJ71R_15825, partial [Nitrososphaeraceae archaeon]
MKKITLIAAGSLLLAAAIVFGLMYNGGYSNRYHLQTASAIEDKNTTTYTTSATTNNAIQLSTKEVKPGVYNWIDTSNGASNPTLKVFVNASNIIKIQNPTDTK